MSAGQQPVLGIIAGSGRLPAQLVEACRSMGRAIFVLSFDADESNYAKDVPHAVVRLGAVGDALEHLRNAGVGEVVMAGKVKRPSIFNLKPDAAANKLLKKLGAAFFSGDDALLKALVAFFEEEGFKVVGAEEIVGELLAPEAVLTSVKPNAQHSADIEAGFKAAKALGARDVGQAVIISNGKVVGAEDEGGTQALIARCTNAQGGVLVKAKKPGQESRVDLPAIGVGTVEQAHAAGLSGIAVEAGASLVLDRQQVIARADALGLFVVGVRHG